MCSSLFLVVRKLQAHHLGRTLGGAGDDVGAVQLARAVDSGAAAANRMDALMGCYTIARPTPELVEMLQC